MSDSCPANNRTGRLMGRFLDVAIALAVIAMLVCIATELVPLKYLIVLAIVGGLMLGFSNFDRTYLALTSRLKRRLGLPATSWSFQEEQEQ
ncbi:hypothetical protein [Pseudomonas aeruginosa]|uniref:hypothetical protein n=1 Tax=Pseudomonas aeruginosa TaxID=287 RepID=UPI003D2899BA